MTQCALLKTHANGKRNARKSNYKILLLPCRVNTGVEVSYIEVLNSCRPICIDSGKHGGLYSAKIMINGRENLKG